MCIVRLVSNFGESLMAKKVKKRAYKTWTPADLKELKKHSREKTPVAKIAKTMRRSEGTVRMKAYQLGFSVGHRRRKAA
jgi:hypothetical protein